VGDYILGNHENKLFSWLRFYFVIWSFMGEILFPILFFAGLFAINPMTSGMSTKETASVTIGYIAVFVLIAGLIARIG